MGEVRRFAVRHLPQQHRPRNRIADFGRRAPALQRHVRRFAQMAAVGMAQFAWRRRSTGISARPAADYKLLVPWWNNNAFGRHIYTALADYKMNTAGWTSPSQDRRPDRDQPRQRECVWPGAFPPRLFRWRRIRWATAPT